MHRDREWTLYNTSAPCRDALYIAAFIYEVIHSCHEKFYTPHREMLCNEMWARVMMKGTIV